MLRRHQVKCFDKAASETEVAEAGSESEVAQDTSRGKSWFEGAGDKECRGKPFHVEFADESIVGGWSGTVPNSTVAPTRSHTRADADGISHRSSANAARTPKASKCLNIESEDEELLGERTTGQQNRSSPFSGTNKLDKLMVMIDQDLYYKCDLCSYASIWPAHMRSHYRRHLDEGMATASGNETAAKPTRSEVSPSYEEDQELQDAATKASSEGAPMFNITELIIDNQRHFKCDLCNYATPLMSRMRLHYTCHTEERPFTCEQCGRQFKLRSTLQTHIKGVHLGVRRHRCDLCGHHFKEKRYLEIHRRLHTGERLLVCEVCGASFSHRASLIAHQRTHSLEPSFQCSICANTFCHESSFRVHMKRHRGELNHRCDVCDKAFITSTHLHRHKAIHSKDRPFGCDLCGAKFKLMKYLQSHRKSHRKVTNAAQEPPVFDVDSSESEEEEDESDH